MIIFQIDNYFVVLTNTFLLYVFGCIWCHLFINNLRRIYFKMVTLMLFWWIFSKMRIHLGWNGSGILTRIGVHSKKWRSIRSSDKKAAGAALPAAVAVFGLDHGRGRAHVDCPSSISIFNFYLFQLTHPKPQNKYS